LTERQKRFVSEYLIDLNASAAAIRAGYSKRSAAAIGSKALKLPEVAEKIAGEMKLREQRTGVTQDRVLEELAKLAFSDYTDYTRVVSAKGAKKVWNGETGEYETAECDMKILDVTETASLSAEKKSAISGIKETKYGIVVDIYDKMKALELVGRHVGMFKGNEDMLSEPGSRKTLAEAIQEAYYKRLNQAADDD